MTLKRLAIRTKKSLSGLYSFDSDQVSPASDTTSNQTSPIREYAPYACDEFGMASAGDCSPVRDSPSRRKRLLGSLRRMGSLRSMRSNHNHTKTWEDLPSKPEPEVPQTPSREMPSLALNFEVSPPDQPMFAMRKMPSSSSMVVPRSSPITVPTSAKQPTPTFNTPPGLSAFTVGTVPDSPAPLQRASVQEAILSHAADAVLGVDASFSGDRSASPLPTPMPGSNLPPEDRAAPEIVVSSRSAPTKHSNIVHSDTAQDSFSVDFAKEYVREREDSAVLTDELDPAADADIVAMLAMTADAIPDHPSEASSAQLEPVHSDEAASLRIDGGDFAYVVWDDPAIAIEDKCHHERGPSSWSRHTGLYDGTGYGEEATRTASHPSTSDYTEADTETTDLTAPDEVASDAKVVDAIIQLVGTFVQPEAQVYADDKETLQDIIRAYAGPMLYHEEADAHRASEHSDDFSEFQAAPLDEVTSANAKAEVEDSIRVMNTSLGG